MFRSALKVLVFLCIFFVFQRTSLKAEDLLETKLREIQAFTEQYIPLALEEQKKHPEFFHQLASTLQTGSLHLMEEGEGGTYLLKDEKGEARFIIKPTDENIHCLHNPKLSHYPLPEVFPREDIPLYESALREAFCYELANLVGLEKITPKTYLTFLSHPGFFLFSSKGSFVKLCSVSEYIPNTLSLRSLLESLFSLSVKDEELGPYFSEEDFDLINLFVWLTYDTDAHASNILAYRKETNTNDLPLYGLIKIDNSLTFPQKNRFFFHFLMHFPLARRELSSLIREKIVNLPIKALEESLENFHLTSSLPALRERVFVLKELIKRPSLSYYEVSLRLMLLEKEGNKEAAISLTHLEELEKLLPNFL